MPDLFELLESKNLTEFKNLVEAKLYQSVKEKIEQRKSKVVAEMFSKERSNLFEAKAEPQVISPVQDLIHTGQKYGFTPVSSENTQYGKIHTLAHPTGHELRVHQTRKKCFWAHHTLDEGNYVNHGHGDSPDELRKHFGKFFPKPQAQVIQVEAIAAKFGKDLVEAVRELEDENSRPF